MSVPKWRCPACGSTNPADAAACRVCGFMFSASPHSMPTPAPEAQARLADDEVSAQHNEATEVAHTAVSPAHAGVPSSQWAVQDDANRYRRGMVSLAALLSLSAFGAIALLVFAVFRSIAADADATVLSLRSTEATTVRSASVLDGSPLPAFMDTLPPTETPLPPPTPTETPFPSPTPTETPLPLPTETPVVTPTEAVSPSLAPTETPLPTTPPAKAETYTVQQRDTCWAIATRFGISVEQLVAQNRLSPQCVIRPGQVLTITR
jgi:LysM repeat protein